MYMNIHDVYKCLSELRHQVDEQQRRTILGEKSRYMKHTKSRHILTFEASDKIQ